MENYEVLQLIGEGSFGRVFRARRKHDGEEVALKLIPKVGRNAKDLASLRQECQLQKELRHPHIVIMMDAFETHNEIVAVTEYIPTGDLTKILQSKNPSVSPIALPEERVRDLTIDLLSALHYLHSNRILHRDIKPQNILIGPRGEAKLCDFGFARNLSVSTMVVTSIKGTPLYMAPELISEKPYDHSADLWSLGCIVYEMAVGTHPFATKNLLILIRIIRYEKIDWPQHLSRDLRDFLQGLLEKDPKRRMSWPQILRHPFIKDRIKGRIETNCPLKTDLTSSLTESQELAKEIQRQDKAKLLPGGSQTLIKVAEKYEQQKKLLLAARQLQERRFSDVGLDPGPRPFWYQAEAYNGDRRRHSDLPVNYSNHPQVFHHPSATYANHHQGPIKIPADPLPSVQKNYFQVSKAENSQRKPSKEDPLFEMSAWSNYLDSQLLLCLEDSHLFFTNLNDVGLLLSHLNKFTGCLETVLLKTAQLFTLPLIQEIDSTDVKKVLEIYEKVELVPSMLKACTKVMDIYNQEDPESKKAAALRVTLTLVSRLVHTDQMGFLTQVCLSLKEPVVSGMFQSIISHVPKEPSLAIHSISILNKVLATSENSQCIFLKSTQILPLLSQTTENKELLSKLVILFALTQRLETRDSRPRSPDTRVIQMLDFLGNFVPNEVKFCRKFIVLSE